MVERWYDEDWAVEYVEVALLLQWMSRRTSHYKDPYGTMDSSPEEPARERP